MMDCLQFMRVNMATCCSMDFHSGWEQAERMSPYKRHSHSLKFNHRPREWLLEAFGNKTRLVPYDLAPVDPRMSAEERSWAIWDGAESARCPVKTHEEWLLEGRRYGPHHKIRTPEEIMERHRNGL